VYLLELVRYIHLNPLRAGLVKDLRGLRSYRYGGHSVLVGRHRNEWQDKDYVLSFFGSPEKTAMKYYVSFVRKGLDQGRRPELVGGGLVRSVGGWFALQALRSEPMRVKGDERILGSSEFVEEVLEKAEEQFEQRTLIKSRGLDSDTLVSKVARSFRIDTEDLKTASKLPNIVKARAVYCYLAVRKLYVSCASIARQLHISPSAVSKAVIRGQEIVRENDLEAVLLEIES
jgi:putative transposase